MNIQEFGKLLRETRAASGLKIDAFAERCQISRQNLIEIEKGKNKGLRPKTALALSHVLKMPLDAVLTIFEGGSSAQSFDYKGILNEMIRCIPSALLASFLSDDPSINRVELIQRMCTRDEILLALKQQEDVVL